MKRKLLFNAERLQITLRRLCAELVEQHGDFSQSVLLGLQPRGVFLARRLRGCLLALGHEPPLGTLDATLHRDDFGQRNAAMRQPHPTDLQHTLEGKRVVLIDDVLYTGRTVRAALDALLAYGRPAQIELLVLIDRSQSRHVPIAATYVGCSVHTRARQRILLELTEQKKARDGIWLIEQDTEEPKAAS